MVENILPIDSATPVQPSNPPAQNLAVTTVAPKKFPIFSVLLLIVLTVISVICVYLFLQVRELSISQPVPSASPVPVASADPTSNWQVYRNQKFDFSFKYPQDFSLHDAIDQVGDRFIIQNFSTEIGRTIKETDYQMIIALGPNEGRSLDWYITNASRELGKFPVERISIGGVEAIKGQSGQKQVSVPTIWVIKGEYIYTIQLPTSLPESEKVFDQILSTFKFTDSSMSYTCPASGYADCMPSPDGPKPSCSKEAMDWYKVNCPDFKGAAL